jgi:hypothetical protein
MAHTTERGATIRHVQLGGGLSPPASEPAWTEWSHAWGGEMRLKRALEKLNLEYPRDSD